MSRVFVHGWGVVSPAGWDAPKFLHALSHRLELPTSAAKRPDGALRSVRRVPALSPRPAWLSQPRLRRSSAITHFVVAAAGEALEAGPADGVRSAIHLDRTRVGVVCAVMGGGVSYSRRFYEEVRQNPQLASPLLFPETVFNAPASHLGALLGSAAPNDTLVSDQTGFFSALAVAAGWLQNGGIEACLVVAAEESDWLTAEAAHVCRSRLPMAEGAGAVLLRCAHGPVELLAIAEPEPLVVNRSRSEATMKVRNQLAPWEPLAEYSERAVSGVFGDGLAAAGAWVAIAAIAAVAGPVGPLERVSAQVTGANLQAHGAVFGRSRPMNGNDRF